MSIIKFLKNYEIEIHQFRGFLEIRDTDTKGQLSAGSMYIENLSRLPDIKNRVIT